MHSLILQIPNKIILNYMENKWYLVLLTALFLGCNGKTEQQTGSEDDWSDYDERFYNPHRDEFMKWVQNNSETLYMDLEDKAEQAEVQLVSSSDGKVRVYTWVSGGGTSPDWSNFTQYEDNQGVVRSMVGLPLQGTAYGGTLTDVLYAGQLCGRRIYFLDFYSKASSAEGYNTLYSAELRTDTFALGPPFRLENGELKESISIDYYIPDWYFKTNGEGWDQITRFVPEEQTLYRIVSDEKMQLNGSYQRYKYDSVKDEFRYIGSGGSPFVHSSIRDYATLVVMSETEQHRIRIDSLRDGSYRMALWYHPSTASWQDKPTMVLSGGRYLKDSGEYEFKAEGGLTYIYDEMDEAKRLILLCQGKRMFTESKRDYRRSIIEWAEKNLPEYNEYLSDCLEVKLTMVTDNYMIRVDSIEGGLRYASWKHDYYMTGEDQPELVLLNGVKKSRNLSDFYEFRNGGYVYQIPLYTYDRMKVQNSNKIICNESVWFLFSYETSEPFN